MTLLELLVVMGIIGTLLGLGVGAFNHLAAADRVAAGQIMDAMRSARMFALREGAPASVVVEPARAEVYGLGLRGCGNWHFEDPPGRGWPVDATLPPDVAFVPGEIGTGIQLSPEQVLTVDDLPTSFDSPDGFGVEVSLRPEPEPRPMRLLERPGAWTLRLDQDGALEVSVMLDASPAPEEFRQTLPGVRLPADRWTQLAVIFDGRSLHVAVDGAAAGEDAAFEPSRRAARGASDLITTGHRTEAYRGGLDELRIASVVRGEHRGLPDAVVLDGAPRVLHLDAAGHLDPGWHAAPVSVSFTSGAPPVRTVIEYGLLGSVRSWTESP